ncbi:hypothetical protein L6164_025222 [Bauhinia variegata]|uniref:Uncharacterized protein n=1 Tax=Bauhinia variegata TaxID=167791 RepID=A0ACB9M097_BAUVA|nr:hypothetical protein L6164_025222 [Bauhinia variegata]
MNSWGSNGGQEAHMRGFMPREINFGLVPELHFALGTRPDNENLQLEAVDDGRLDDVVIISPRKFEEAKNKGGRRYAHRRHGTTHSAETCSFPVSNNNGGTPDRPIVIVDCELSLKVGDSRKKQKTDDSDVPPPAVPPSYHPPKAPKFSCGICMCELTDATSTKCGHIFCKECLVAAIAFQHKCPSCRRKLRKNDMFRVYLPEAIL